MKTINQFIMPKTAKRNSKGNLELGGCDCLELAEKYGTPLYVMCKETLVDMAQSFKNAFEDYPNFQPTYASKALMTKKIAEILHSEGFGFDAVSGGEIYTMHKAGVDMSKVTFNGNNKTPDEIKFALEVGIGHFSVDNFSEIEDLADALKGSDKTQPIHLRITPGIECHTHEYIQTGHLDSKFGFDLSQTDSAVEEILKHKNLELKGLHAHIGSQIFETKVFEDEVEVLIKEIVRLNKKFNLNLNEINIGGGLGITYTEADTPPSVYEIAEIIKQAIDKNCKKYSIEKPKLFIEPGRSIVGTAGVTLYKAGSSKQVPNGKKYVALDGGMADNPRPSMYGAEYIAEVANNKVGEPLETVTLSGRYCESGDILIKNTELPKIQKGDILCIYNTGAYNYSMSSNYNRILKPAVVLVNQGQPAMIVSRQTYEQLLENDL
ncbi:diaminopimelate decarboxylase [bacterium]|nr:diaminopimelate decarboxylase [bacterium]